MIPSRSIRSPSSCLRRWHDTSEQYRDRPFRVQSCICNPFRSSNVTLEGKSLYQIPIITVNSRRCLSRCMPILFTHVCIWSLDVCRSRSMRTSRKLLDWLASMEISHSFLPHQILSASLRIWRETARSAGCSGIHVFPPQIM